jgi:signal transduction histidine kinase
VGEELIQTVEPAQADGDTPPGDSSPQAARYAELAELAGGFIHEMKNHLGTLKLQLELLAEDFQDGQSPREKRAFTKVQKLQTECQRLEDLSKDFLTFARINELEREPSDLADVIDELIEFYTPTAEKGNIRIHRLLPADLPLVCLNREMFKQALLNLFLNAQQAMPSGGDLTIQGSVETSLRPYHPGDGRDGPLDTVCLSIIDTGVGMSPDVLARVFRPFYSKRPGGTGLGLPTTRKIIEAHDGTIEAQSAVGRGTRFAIRLPLAEAPSCPAG